MSPMIEGRGAHTGFFIPEYRAENEEWQVAKEITEADL